MSSASMSTELSSELPTEIQKRAELANRLAVIAGKLTLKYFQKSGLDVVRKGDGSPVTVADQEAETFLRREISTAFPDDGIVGEEYGVTKGESGYNWVLDPIDGTKSFISGVPLYGTMVGVERVAEDQSRKSVVGSVYLPGLGEGIFATVGQGAWHFVGDGQPQRAKVSQISSLSDAVLVTSQVETFSQRQAMDVYHQLAESVYFSRTWGDVYGYLLVATGRVDVMIDPVLNLWDAAAVQPIIEEAGGRFTDWRGQTRIDGGEAIGSNGLLHESVLAITRSVTTSTSW